MTLTPGTRLGPYEIQSQVGAGSMGAVYKAHDPRLNRSVAVKIVIAQRPDRFEAEARAIAALNHPNICQIYDIGPDYLVLEYLAGDPLSGPVSLDDARRLAIQMADALEAAHRRGILHRDLKPANVMVVRRDGIPIVKLLDFGIARLVGSDVDATRTVAGDVIGTPAYMSPEQAQGQPLDERSDVFSLGAVIYELLSGRRAFPGDSVAQVLSAVLRDDPPPLDVPGGWLQIVARCLEKEPAGRFQSMHELKQALEGVASATQQPAVPSIAVLPFANMSSDPEQEYFSDGLTEEIINTLAQFPGLKVIARTSSFAFKGKHVDIRDIARALGVTTILEGSVRKGGSRIRVTAQLINVADGSHLWSERYDRDLADVFEVQDDIADAIGSALRGKLMVTLASRLYVPRVEAYDAYLMARHLEWTPIPTALDESRASYERAAALDPGYAAPHAGLANICHIAACGRGPAAQAHRSRVREEAERALVLDPDLAEAHGWLGVLATSYDYDWAEARRRFEVATACDARLLYRAGYFHLRFIGRAAEAVAAHEAALRDDPLSLITRAAYVLTLLSAGRRADAARESRRLIETAPAFAAAYTLLAFDLPAATLSEALRFAEDGHALCGHARWSVGSTGLLAGLLRRAGNNARSETLMQSIDDPDVYGNPVDHALFHLAQDDTDAAMSWIERAVDQQHPFAMMVLIGGPYGERIREASAWPRIAGKVNLPAASSEHP